MITACGNIVKEGVQNTHHWSGPIDDATDELLPQWRHNPAGPLRSQSLFQFVQISNEYSKYLLLQYQLDSNLADLEATVKVELI